MDDQQDGTVTLAPDRVLASIWASLGILATAFAAYAFGSASQLQLLYGVLVLLCAGVAGIHLLQVLAPAAWTLEIDREGVRGHVATLEVEHRFAGLRAVELERRLGDPTLVLLGSSGRRRLLLPVGCDLAALRELLADLERDASRVSTGRTAVRDDDASA